MRRWAPSTGPTLSDFQAPSDLRGLTSIHASPMHAPLSLSASGTQLRKLAPLPPPSHAGVLHNAERVNELPRSKSKSALAPLNWSGAAIHAVGDTSAFKRKRDEKERERDIMQGVRQQLANLPSLNSPNKSGARLSRSFKSSPLKAQLAASSASRRDQQIGRSLSVGVLCGTKDDVSPAILRLEQLKRNALRPLSAGTDDGIEDEGEPNEEVKSWMLSTLSSIPNTRNNSKLSSSGAATAPTEPEPHMSTPVSPAPAGKDASASAGEVTQEYGPLEDEDGVPDASEALRRYRDGDGQSLKTKHLARIQKAFSYYKVPDSPEIHRTSLGPFLEHLGYMQVRDEAVEKIVSDLTMYNTLDLSETVAFIESFSKFEEEEFKRFFDRLDVDGSGSLNHHEIHKFLVELGFTPLRAMVREALSIVDQDGSGDLDFREVLHLIAVYRVTEGFTRKEVLSLRAAFGKKAVTDNAKPQSTNMPPTKPELVLPVEDLTAVLLDFFGPHSVDKAREVGESAIRGRSPEIDASGNEIPVRLNFSEVLTWARQMRSNQHALFRKYFEEADVDKTGDVSRLELLPLITKLGYTLLPSVLDEFIDEANEEQGGKIDDALDFDEFVNLMHSVTERDGFSHAEMTELNACFAKFDADGSGEFDHIELSDALRYMGHNVKLDRVQQVAAVVDYSMNGLIDHQEFLRLMRIFREEEIAKMREVFDKHKNARGQITDGSLYDALAALGYRTLSSSAQNSTGAPVQCLQEGVLEKMPDLWTGEGRFEEFVNAVDRCRVQRVKEQRRCAGFSKVELERCWSLFLDMDKDNSGLIDGKEVHELLEVLGLDVSTAEKRNEVLQQMEDARNAAKKVGVENTHPQGGAINFWVLIQLLRVQCTRDDKHVLDRETRAIEQTNFSQDEVNQFREVFFSWYEKGQMFEETEGNIAETSRVSIEEGGTKDISKGVMRRFLRTLGISLSNQEKDNLDAKIDEFGGGGRVDFSDFLRLMHWMTTVNFANINGASAKAARS